MDASPLLATRQRIETDLRDNILPFWIRQVVDPVNGSFHGELSNDLAVDRTVERGALLSCRILWTYAAAFGRYQQADLLRMAEYAYHDLLERFLDRTHGGFIWSIRADGRPARSRKQVYGQAFAIYALTEFHRASGRPEPLQQAIALHQLLERHARDTVHGGYFEAYAQDWSPIADMRLSEVDLNEPKSQNTLLHVMEAYTNLLRAWPDPALRRSLHDLVEIMLTRVLNADTHHLGLFFSDDWRPRSDRISYGHDIEAAWLLTEAAAAIGDAALLARTKAVAVRIAEITLAEGVDHDGAICNEGGPHGVVDARREWWPQAEAVVGFLNAAEISGEERFLAAALRTWAFIESHLIDRQHGEWFRCVGPDGVVASDQAKVSFWKCPYHNGRMALEALTRLTALAGGETVTRPAQSP